VIEGVMIRADDRWAVAVRRPDGEIVCEQATVPAWAGALRRVPVLRGALALVATVALGMRALSWSRAASEGDEGRPPSKAAVAAATIISIGILVSLFAVLPALGARMVADDQGALFATVEAVLRLTMLVAYIAAIGRLPGIRRTFEYHGAEHQAVAAFEAGAHLDLESVRTFSPRHARCGTDFLVLVALVAVLVFALISVDSWWAMLASRVLLLPVVAGLAYELLRLSDHSWARRWLRPVLAPGLAVQRLTTRPPTDAQIEVAIAAVQGALAPERAS
jgi:uncharacterized protein YqhQ